MSAQKFVRVFQLAVARTVDKSLKWGEAPDEDEFEASLANFTIRVWKQARGFGMYILDAEGRSIGRVDEDLLRLVLGIDTTNAREQLWKLWSAARSSALKIDETLDALIDQLSQPKSRDADT